MTDPCTAHALTCVGHINARTCLLRAQYTTLTIAMVREITPVLVYAMELCHSTEMGGRMITGQDLTRGKIVDCSCWPDDYSQAILARFPDCCIVFLSSQVFS